MFCRSRNSIILERIKILIKEKENTNGHIWVAYNKAIDRMWEMYGNKRKKSINS